MFGIETSITLFVVLDPIGSVPIFLNATSGLDKHRDFGQGQPS
jgi:small neutral amino acid transporter SnatA (MarC family)